ncbi:hypothetical protein OPQ81_002690 [Rhizoctonia solani]|nr:hypothetical protein OPQ81_002690 [Rhizoctonia solani]
MAESQWHDAFPAPPFDTPRISAEALAEIITQKIAGLDYIVVDARRTDFENVFIKGGYKPPGSVVLSHTSHYYCTTLQDPGRDFPLQ